MKYLFPVVSAVNEINLAVAHDDGGVIDVLLFPANLPPKHRAMSDMEAMIFHFKQVMEGVPAPAGEAYFGIENPKGELGFYLISDGGPNPYRYRVRPPSLINLTVLEDMCLGLRVADAVIILGSVDIVLGEVDR